jgi:hypothetical protein
MAYAATTPANPKTIRHQRAGDAINRVTGTMRPLLVAKGVPLQGQSVPTKRVRYGALIDGGDPPDGGAAAIVWAALNSGTQCGWPGSIQLSARIQCALTSGPAQHQRRLPTPDLI